METEKILGVFDAAFLINASDQGARLANAWKWLEREGILFERFPAITVGGGMDALRAKELGCMLSHLEVVRIAKERKLGNVLIFEDDVVFRPYFKAVWNDIVESVRKVPFDLFYFYDWNGAKSSQPGPLLRPIVGTQCTHAYAVGADYYDQFLQMPVAIAIDQALYLTECRKWAITPGLVGQAAGFSTIHGAERKLRWSAADG